MKGDFTRDTFDPHQHFIRVLMQQGRVQLDADWNEQAAILLHYLQSLARDLIGPFGGPGDGFKIEQLLDNTGTVINNDFAVSAGNYYVDGILCENERDLAYTGQPDYPLLENPELGGIYLVYLDVWERHVTWVEYPNMREIALGGPDTATRAKIVWQVKVTNEPPTGRTLDCTDAKDHWQDWIDKWQPPNRGRLKARAKKPATGATDPCAISPEFQFRGPENQLYRVEIHTEGNAGTATFKWSRDNGAVIFPIRKLAGGIVTLYNLGPDDRRGLQPGQWVEIMDDDRAKRGEALYLLQIADIDRVEKIVALSNPDNLDLPQYDEDTTAMDESQHPLLRRWDTQPGAESAEIVIEEGTTDDDWIDLEDGVQIQFRPAPVGEAAQQYGTGDYWLIPARIATGDVLWPKARDENDELVPAAKPPHGITHHFAPLAIITVTAGAVAVDSDCRCMSKLACAAPAAGTSLSATAAALNLKAEAKPLAASKKKTTTAFEKKAKK